MTLTSHYCAVSNPMIRFPDIPVKKFMKSRSDIVEDLAVREEEIVYVLVSKDVEESEANLRWALHNFDGMKFCILHVHQPSKKIPLVGPGRSMSQPEDHQGQTYSDAEKQHMHNVLEIYSRICEQAGARAEKLHIEMDSVEKGIVDLITIHNIKKLVMEAAADELYSKYET